MINLGYMSTLTFQLEIGELDEIINDEPVDASSPSSGLLVNGIDPETTPIESKADDSSTFDSTSTTVSPYLVLFCSPFPGVLSKFGIFNSRSPNQSPLESKSLFATAKRESHHLPYLTLSKVV